MQLFILSMLLPACDIFNSSTDWTDNQIAYRADGAIYLMCLDTGALRKLVEPARGGLRWSPDGKWLAHSGPGNTNDGTDWLYLFDCRSNNKRVLTLWERQGHFEPHPDGGGHPAWSPDGDRVAFNRRVDWHTNPEIFIVSIDTSSGIKETRVTNNPFRDTLYDWSPDGARLLIKSSLTEIGTYDESSDLYTVNTDGSDKQKILEINESFGAIQPRYSPDGIYIAFIRTGDVRDIYIMNADGSDISRITNNELDERSLSWSPDSSRLVFVAGSHNDGGHIYRIESNGKNLRQVTRGEGIAFHAEWRSY